MVTYFRAVLQGVHRAEHTHGEAPAETGAFVWFLGEQTPFQKHLFLEVNLLKVILNAQVYIHEIAH